MTGIAVIRMKLVINVIHVNVGMRISFMPGPRRFTMVVMKLTPPRIELIPRMERPTNQKSVFGPGENWIDVRLA